MKETGWLLWRGRGIGSESLWGRVAVVTGASSGIGAAVASALASEGAHQALASRREDALLRVQDRLHSAGDKARSLIVPTDVTDRQQVRSLVACAEQELGPVDILVNCAGVMYYTLVWFPEYTTPRLKVPCLTI